MFSDDELAQAIGINGSNIKLSSNVTDYKIDAVSLSEYNKNQTVDINLITDIASKYRKILIENKILTTSDFLNTELDNLIGLKGLGEKSVDTIKLSIEDYLLKN